MALGGLLAAQAAYAQDAERENDPESEEAPVDENVIIVSGIRASLENAQNIKRGADTVVDAITAEDIGALPDRSVTEALQRVPGVTINRFAASNDPDHFSVEGSGVDVRGLNFVRSEFNGRTAFVAGVNGQALNFADVPPELLGSVIVSKNSTAEMIEGGVAGTVNLITRKPFDNYGLNIGFSIEANYGDFRKEWTPTISGLVSNTWETGAGTFGLLVSGSYSRLKSRADGLQITNYQTRDNQLVTAAFANGNQVCRNPLPLAGTDNSQLPPPNSPCGTAQGPGPDGYADFADIRYAPIGGQFRTQEFDRKRDGIAVSGQWESEDQRSRLTAEFIRSHATSKWGEYTFETQPDSSEYDTYPLGCEQNSAGPFRRIIDGRGGYVDDPGQPTTRAQCQIGEFQDYLYDGNNVFQAGYITRPSDGWRGNDAAGGFVTAGGMQQQLARRQVDEETTNTDYSLHFTQELTDRLTIDLDGQYAKSKKSNLDVSIYGSTFADQELDLTGNIPVVIPHIPNVLSYTWAGDNPELAAQSDEEYFRDPRSQFWRAAMDHIEESDGEQFAFRADLNYEFPDDSFLRYGKTGARYSGTEQNIRFTTYNWGVLSEVWAGTPVSFDEYGEDQQTFYEFPDFFRGDTPGPVGAYYYAGDLTGDYAGFADFARGLIAEANAQGFDGGPDAWMPLASREGANGPFIAGDIQNVKQDDFAVYAMVGFGNDIDPVFGNITMTGNIGLRYVNTIVNSPGIYSLGGRANLGIEGTFDERCGGTIETPDGRVVTPGGICTLGPAGYAELARLAELPESYQPNKAEYDYFLPSVNVKFDLTDDLILRFAGSKVLTRPDNAFLRNFLDVTVDPSGSLFAQAGNPSIRPATAWQFDATLEWYFAPVGAVTLNGFYKSIDDFFFQEIVTEDYLFDGVTVPILTRRPANFDGTGKIKGFEVAYQQTYDFLPAPLDGLGVAANYTYIDSTGLPASFLNGGNIANNTVELPSTVAPGNLPLERLSKHNVNATVFYEKGPISMRAAYNWRSRFLLTASDAIFPFYSIFNEPTGQLDASIFFNVTDNIKIGAQGVNLTNEITKTTQAFTGDPNLLAPRSYFMNDRRFSLVVRGQF